jgi:hypothetical protein
MPNKAAYWVGKTELLEKLLKPKTKSELIDNLFAGVGLDEEQLRRFRQNYSSLLKGVKPQSDVIFKQIIVRFEISGASWDKLVSCTAAEFFDMLSPTYRAVLQQSMTNLEFMSLVEEWRRITGQSDWVIPEASSLRSAHRDVLAGVHLLSRMERIRSINDTRLSEVLNCISWMACTGLQKFLHDVLEAPQAMVMIVGPKANHSSMNFDIPVFLAATGFTSEPPNGTGLSSFSLFMTAAPRNKMFTWPPPDSPPPGERPEVVTALALTAWKNAPGLGFPGMPAQPFEFEGGRGDCIRFETEFIRQSETLRKQYLSLSEDVKVVYVARVVDNVTQRRLVVAVDFIDDRVLNTHQQAYLMEAIYRLLSKIVDIK